MVVDGQLPHGSRGNCYNVRLMEPFLSGQNKPRFIKKKVRKNSERGGVPGRSSSSLACPSGLYGSYGGNKEETGVVFIGIGCF